MEGQERNSDVISLVQALKYSKKKTFGFDPLSICISFCLQQVLFKIQLKPAN